MKTAAILRDEEIERKIKRCMDFSARHPDMSSALDLWLADHDRCRQVHPEAAEIFQRELADL